VRRLVVREDLFLDASDSPKSEYLDCTSNLDDEKSSVPLGTGVSDRAFEDNGMPSMPFTCSIEFFSNFMQLSFSLKLVQNYVAINLLSYICIFYLSSQCFLLPDEFFIFLLLFTP